MNYGYHRTSTKEQHLDRGLQEIRRYCEEHQMPLFQIYTDQQTGKNFDRPRYTDLVDIEWYPYVTFLYSMLSHDGGKKQSFRVCSYS